MRTLDQAVRALEDRALVAEVVGADGGYILGGTRLVDAAGIRVYQQSFHIRAAEGGWDVTVSGPGQLNTARQVPSLAAAVDLVHELLA